MDDEIRIIPFSPSYAISGTGEITRLVACANSPVGHVLKQWIGTGGYKRVRLTTNGVTKLWQTHRLLCMVFHGEPPADKPFACHNDGDQLNNRASNLRWDSTKGNSDDRWAHGTMNEGEKSHLAKLSKADVAFIRDYPRYYGSGKLLAEKFRTTRVTISAIRYGRMRKFD